MTFFSRILNKAIQTIPFECALCQHWPSHTVEGTFGGISGVCQSCIQTHAHAPRFPIPPGLDDCVAAVSFSAPWSALIARYKFAPEPGMARLFAGLLLRDEHVRTMIAQVDVAIPLPLAPERLEERGFNQSLQLAKYLCGERLIDCRSLIRTRDTVPQRTLGREARQQNVAGAFGLQTMRGKGYSDSTPSFAGQHILLLDDVMTTGATLSAAAKPLRKAGAASVSAVVIAHTPLL